MKLIPQLAAAIVLAGLALDDLRRITTDATIAQSQKPMVEIPPAKKQTPYALILDENTQHRLGISDDDMAHVRWCQEHQPPPETPTRRIP